MEMQNLENQSIDKTKKQKNKKTIWIILGVIVLVVILGFLAWRFGMGTNLGGMVAKVFPMPVARVNGGFVLSNKMDKNFTALKFFYSTQEGQQEGKLGDLEIKKMVLDRLIEDQMVSNLGKKYNIKVTSKDVDDEYKIVLEDYSSEEELTKEIKKLYDLSIVDFKDEVLKPSIYYDKLMTVYLKDNKVDPERKKKDEAAKKKAEEALVKLKSSKDFAELAKEVSEDKTTKKQGGDLGFIGKDEMEKEFEDAAFKLKEGEMSGLVRTIEGWHIIKVEKKKGTGKDEQVKARHILFAVEDDFDKWFLEQKKKAKVNIYIKDIKWNKEKGEVDGLSEGEEQNVDANDIEIEDVEVEPVK